MKPKIPVILLLLSIFSVYFLCPVLCSSLRGQTCSVSAAGQPTNKDLASVRQSSGTDSDSSTCCGAKKSDTNPDNNTDEENDNCCPDHLGIFKTIDYQRFSQSLEKSTQSVATVASFLEFPAFPRHSTVILDRHTVPIPASPSYDISPRAPPFFLA